MFNIVSFLYYWHQNRKISQILLYNQPSGISELVSLAAVFSVVTQRSSPVFLEPNTLLCKLPEYR